LLRLDEPEPQQPVAGQLVEIIERWSGDPMKRIEGEPVVLELAEAYLLYWMAAMTVESPPWFELLVEPRGVWTAAGAAADVVVASKGRGAVALGPSPAAAGWQLWWAARSVGTLTGVPDGSLVTLAIAPVTDRREQLDSPVGRALYEAKVAGGRLHIGEAAPKVPRDTLEQALAFTRDAATHGRVSVSRAAERTAFDAAVESYVFEEDTVTWKGDAATLAEPDERTLLLLASAVFRVRFAGHWPMASA
jgi:hypothetical protein